MKNVLSALTLCLLISLPMQAQTTTAPDEKAPNGRIEEAIKPYAKCGAIAQDLASDAKTKFKDDSAALSTARGLYAEALGNAEAYTAKLEISIIKNRKTDFTAEAKQLVDSVNALNDFVRPKTRLEAVAGIGIAELIKGLIDGAIAIWKECRAQDDATKERLLERVKSKRWLPWDKIGS